MAKSIDARKHKSLKEAYKMVIRIESRQREYQDSGHQFEKDLRQFNSNNLRDNYEPCDSYTEKNSVVKITISIVKITIFSVNLAYRASLA